MKDMEKQAANCLRQVLEGKVSWDHLIEEFRKHEGEKIAKIVAFAEETSRKYNRYSKPQDIDRQDKIKIEEIIRILEGTGAGPGVAE